MVELKKKQTIVPISALTGSLVAAGIFSQNQTTPYLLAIGFPVFVGTYYLILTIMRFWVCRKYEYQVEQQVELITQKIVEAKSKGNKINFKEFDTNDIIIEKALNRVKKYFMLHGG